MNNLRKAAEAGASVGRLIHRDPKTDHRIGQRVNPGRQVKRELGLSARQFKKLRKRLNREYKHERDAR